MGLKGSRKIPVRSLREAHFKSLPCFWESRVQDSDRPHGALDPPEEFAKI